MVYRTKEQAFTVGEMARRLFKSNWADQREYSEALDQLPNFRVMDIVEYAENHGYKVGD